MLKMIRNLAFAHRSQHVQHGRFNTEDEACPLRSSPSKSSPLAYYTHCAVNWHCAQVIDYVLGPFPWLLMTVSATVAVSAPTRLEGLPPNLLIPYALVGI
jgi:hypothetical protein